LTKLTAKSLLIKINKNS